MHLKKIKIGNKQTENNVFLAPLAGYTNAVFREMCFNLGAGLTTTEMVSAKGLCYDSKKTEELLANFEGYRGIKACQLFGADPDFMERAAKSQAVNEFDLIDINMGCPMPKIFNNGEGSALLNDLPLAEKVISAVKKSGKSVSVKFRIGVDERHIVAAEFAKMCENAGADLIIVHGRTKDKIYSGEVDYGEIERAKAAVSIPVIANGGVFSLQDAERLMDRTGADGVSVARGAMYNPWIFSELTGREIGEKKSLILWQLANTRKYFGDRFALVFMRKMIAFYIKGVKNCTDYKLRLFSTKTCEEVERILSEIPIF